MMLIVRGAKSRGYLPKHDVDLPMFKHCCGGFIEVTDIHEYIGVFNAHGVQVLIEDEKV